MKNLVLTYNDNELLYLIEEKSEEALEILQEKYLILIKTKIKEMKIPYDKRSDYLEEGLITLNKAVKTFDSKKSSSFYSYFTLLLNRKFIDLLRKRTRDSKIVLVDDLNDYVVDNYIKEGFVFEEPLYLSNIEKEIFKLKFIEGKTSKQIALELKLPIKKVYEATDRIKRKSKKVRNDDKN